MAIQSMTGFGKSEAVGQTYSVGVEIKAVNNRFKDVRFKMSSLFNSLELPLKKELEKFFKRGSFDVYVNHRKNPDSNKAFDLDYSKVEKFIQDMNTLALKAGATVQVNPTDFLRNDFYVEDESREQELQQLLEKAFAEALVDLEKSRVAEGKNLVKVLEEHLAVYLTHFTHVESLRETYQEQIKEKLYKRFQVEGMPMEVDETRFLQEVIFYLEKLDIDEEINRIKSHVEKLKELMGSDGEIGRQIDFLVQELGRETNTIGSKAGKGEISEAVVQMKVQLEKIREQGLNLE